MDSQTVNNNNSNHPAGQDSNNKGGLPVSQDAYDLREMLLQQRSSNGKRQSQDDSGGPPPKSQAKVTKNQAKDVDNATQGNEGKVVSNILTTSLRGSPQQDPSSSSAQDFQNSDTIIFLPRGNRIENPSSSTSLQSGPSGNSVSSGASEFKTKKAANQQQQPSITLVTSGSLASSSSAPLLSPTTTRMKNTTSSSGSNSPATMTSIKLSVTNTSASSKSSVSGMSSEGLPLSTKFSKISSSSQPPSPKSTPTTPVAAKPAAAQTSVSHASTPSTSTSSVTAPAKQTESGPNGSSASDGSMTREDQLRQQVQATLKIKAANQSDKPIILSTTRKAQPESNSENQAYPAKRPKTGSGSSSGNSGKDAVVGLSLEAIRIESAALNASAAPTASPTTRSTTSTGASTSGSAVTGNSGAGSGAGGGLSSNESKAMAPRNRNHSSDLWYNQFSKDSTDGRTNESSTSTTHQESSRGQDRSDSRSSTSNRDRDRDAGRESDRSHTRRHPSPRSLGRGGYDRDGDRGRYDRGMDRGGYERWDDRGYDRRDDRGGGYGRSGYDSRGYEKGGDYGYNRYDDLRTSDRRRDGSKDRGADRSGDRSGADRTSDRDIAAADRAPPPPPASSDKKQTKESETERQTEQGRDQQKQQWSSDKPAVVDRITTTTTGKDANNKSNAAKKGGVQVEGGPAAAVAGVDSPKDAEVVTSKTKAEPVTPSLPQAPEEPPILFAAANRLQVELNSSPSGQPQQQQQRQQGTTVAADAGVTHDDEAPILFAAANRIQQQHQQQQIKQQIQQQQQQELQQLKQLQQLQQQQEQQHGLNQQLEIEAQQRYQSMKDSATKQLDDDGPILFSSASRLNQDLGSPILFSAASRMMNNGTPSSSSTTLHGSLTAQDTNTLPSQMSLGGAGPSPFMFSSTMATQGPGSGSISAAVTSSNLGPNYQNQPTPSSSSTYSPAYTATSSLNMVMTPQGEIGKSDMSLAFEVMDRCTVDLLLLQQRYATVTSRLTEVTAKALESDARLAQLGAQMELELKMSRVHHQMKNGFEQQQVPDLQRMMRSTQELISRLGHLSTSAAAGSATAVVVRPQLRMVPAVTGGGGGGGGVGGVGGVGAGSTGAGNPSTVALALDRLAQTGHHALSTTAAATAGAASTGDSIGDVRFSGMANVNNSSANRGSDMDIDKASEASSTRNPGTTSGAATALGTGNSAATAAATEETVVVIRPCLSFNIAPKGCRFRASNHPCPYLHTCLYCGSSSHAVMHCDYTSAEPSHDNFFR